MNQLLLLSKYHFLLPSSTAVEDCDTGTPWVPIKRRFLKKSPTSSLGCVDEELPVACCPASVRVDRRVLLPSTDGATDEAAGTDPDAGGGRGGN